MKNLASPSSVTIWTTLLTLNISVPAVEASFSKQASHSNQMGKLHIKTVHEPLAFQSPHSRRDLIEQAAQCIAGAGVLSTAGLPLSPANAVDASKASSQPSEPFSVYEIVPDATAQLSPSIKSLPPSSFVKQDLFSRKKANEKGGVVWLGEHHNSANDHNLQAKFIESIYNERMQAATKKSIRKETKDDKNSSTGLHKMSIGLEQIQVQFQPYLDAFVAGTITEEEMLEGTKWSTRWTWPYENYRPIFNLAQRLNIPLIALNVDSEDLALVEKEGFPGLPKSTLRKYIKDPIGFSKYSKPPAYRAYSAYVIEPSYYLHRDMGLLKTTISGQMLENDMSFINFFSGRILWDEAMAGNAFQWTKDNKGGLMIGLIGADHVKFEKGVVGRFQRLVEYDAAKSLKSNEDVNNENASIKQAKNAKSDAIALATSIMNVSVLLNPTLIDTRPSGSASAYMNAASSQFPDTITLQLRYLKEGILFSSEGSELPSNTGGVLPLADYIVISNANTNA